MAALQDHPVVLALGWMLVHSLWQAGLIALLVRLLWLFISRKYARWRYGLSLIGMLLIMVSAGSTFWYYLDYYAISGPVSIMEVNRPVEAVPPASFETILPPYPEEIVVPPDLPVAEMTEPPFSWEAYMPYLVVLWGLGALLFSLRLAGSWWYIRRVSRRGLILPDEIWTVRIEQVMHRMGMRRKVRIYFSRLVDEPLTFGHLKPMILFPVGLVNQLSIEQVEAILLHELAHIYRRDYLVNWLQSVLELLFFYHPAIWWLSAEVRKAREHCCDDLVLRRGKAPRKLYAQTLTQLAALSFKPKTKLVMSIKGIKNAFSQRVLRLYGQNQAVLDWRKPVLSLALGCMLLPLLWLIQPVVVVGDTGTDDQTEMIMETTGLETGSEDELGAPNDLITASSVPQAALYPVSAEDMDLAGGSFYDQLQLEPIIDPSEKDQGWNPLSVLPRPDALPGAIASPYVQPKLLAVDEPLFIVDGKQIPRDAPFREISRDDIDKFIWKSVPWAPERVIKLAPHERNGVVEIKTKSGSWPGGRPYWPLRISTREISYSDYLYSWFPMGKANSRKEIGEREGLAFLPGAKRVVRKIWGKGKETYSILNGRVLEKDEVVEVNQHSMFGSRLIHAIGLYDNRGKLIYGERAPSEINDRTMVLQFKNGYYAVISKYPCDNRIYLRSYTELNQYHPFDYYLHEQLYNSFDEVKVRKVLRICDNQTEPAGSFGQSTLDKSIFIVDGQTIPAYAPLTSIEPTELAEYEFLTREMKPPTMESQDGLINVKTRSGKWNGGRPYWPYEIKGKRINKKGQTIYMSLDGYFLQDEETKVVNTYELVGMQGLSVIGVYDEQEQLVLGKTTPPEIEKNTYFLKLRNKYKVVVSKYPCDANLFLTCAFTLEGLEARRDIWQQTQIGTEGISMQMMEQHCRQIEERREGQTVHKPVTPEPLFIIDGQIIDPAEPYREVPNGTLSGSTFIQPDEAIARFGKKARYGAKILQSKEGEEKWTGGKPYSPLYKLLGGNRETQQIENFADCRYYFIDGLSVRAEDFNRYNIFNLTPGTISATSVAGIHGLDGEPVDLMALQQQVGNEGIAFELGSGIVVTKYLNDCLNPIKIARIYSPRTTHLAREENRLREAISFRERSVPCEQNYDPEQNSTEAQPEKLLEMTDNVLSFFELQQKLKNSLKVYPSPFNEEVRIAFTLPEGLETKVSILSPEGKLIRQLVNEKLRTGAHEFIWNARGQSAGNYWIRIEAGEVQLTRPLLKQGR